ncbi:DUF4190 domain-containing protein [Ahniella affigens]|uniref:DUF4190 domain-containing protein n=1 Tax=Ahniella affigens TaxID=2021234 RepID=A0A2P1PPW1_9GAMM|nr:DUF4190 domain-containing protein [Ahniella affigens]AVP96877.1 DUF4190 domain-containing protein [Ahniella affigens]
MNQPSLPNSNMAVISLVTGILGWLVLPFICALIAIVCGHLARREIRAANGQLGGDGMATIGLILGYAQIILSIIGVIFVIIAIAFFGFALTTAAH